MVTKAPCCCSSAVESLRSVTVVEMALPFLPGNSFTDPTVSLLAEARVSWLFGKFVVPAGGIKQPLCRVAEREVSSLADAWLEEWVFHPGFA